MTQLVAVILMFSFLGGTISRDCPGVSITSSRPQKMRKRGYLPGNNRRVVFRLVNANHRDVFVYGVKATDEFLPRGYLLIYDEKSRRWLYPTPDNLPVSWTESSEKDTYVLRPGKSITFESEFNQVEVGKRFKHSAYVSFNKGDEPCEIFSEEFILK